MRMTPAFAFVLLALLTGCYSQQDISHGNAGDSSTDSDSDGDSDTDSDGDSDSDSDTDSDSDSDSDADSDSDTGSGSDTGQPDCPFNTGWPCTCEEPGFDSCDDGSDCITLSEMTPDTMGYCGADCDPEDPYCPPTIWGDSAECALAGPMDHFWCVLMCDDSVDCPPGQECQFEYGPGICYP